MICWPCVIAQLGVYLPFLAPLLMAIAAALGVRWMCTLKPYEEDVDAEE